MITLVYNWMQTFLIPTNRNTETVDLYSRLIEEEHQETNDEFSKGRSTEELKECADLLWVTIAKVLSLGYTPEEITKALEAVYESNMSKYSNTKEELEKYITHHSLLSYSIQEIGEGKYVLLNQNSKIQKGPNYHAAKIDLK